MRQVPGQVSVAGRARPQERARPERHVAVDVAREVDAEERKRGVGHRVDHAPHELRALGRLQVLVGAAERDDARVGRCSRKDRQPVGCRARAEHRVARGGLAARVADHDPARSLGDRLDALPRSPPAAPRRASERRRRSRRSPCEASAARPRRPHAAPPRAARRPTAGAARARRSRARAARARRGGQAPPGCAPRSACRSARRGSSAPRSTRTWSAPRPRTCAPSASRARSRSRRG